MSFQNYSAGGDLQHRIRKHGPLDHNIVRHVFAELVSGYPYSKSFASNSSL